MASYSDNMRGDTEFPVDLLTMNFSLMKDGLRDQMHTIAGCHVENGY